MMVIPEQEKAEGTRSSLKDTRISKVLFSITPPLATVLQCTISPLLRIYTCTLTIAKGVDLSLIKPLDPAAELQDKEKHV